MSPMSSRDPDTRYTVVVADKVSPSGLEPLTSDPRFDVIQVAGAPEEELLAALSKADALIVRSATRVTPGIMDAAPRLKAIGRAGVGVDNIDLPEATVRGVPVMNAPAGNTVSAAELAFALLMASARKIVAADRSVRGGEWKRSAFAGTELRGKTLGLVGAGRIGGEVARRAQAFGMTVCAYDPYLTEERAEKMGVTGATLEEVLRESDFVTLHVPLTAGTRGMIGPEELASMKPGAILVNAARGGVVDEEALAQALASGHLGGAALDVYSSEPVPDDSPLRSAPNLVLTPHLGASTADAQELVAQEISHAIRSALLEGDLSRALNAPAIGGESLQRLRPLMALGERAGSLATVLAPGPVREVEICVAGSWDPSFEKPLAASVMCGVLANIQGADRVNFVNALHLAKERGLRLRTAHTGHRPDFSEVLEIRLRCADGEIQVEGAMLGEGHPRIVGIDQYRVDVVPEGSVLVIRNDDVPGVIGRVGTLLGERGLNIAGYHQSRPESGEGPALATVRIDGPVGKDVVAALRALPEIQEVWLAELG